MDDVVPKFNRKLDRSSHERGHFKECDSHDILTDRVCRRWDSLSNYVRGGAGDRSWQHINNDNLIFRSFRHRETEREERPESELEIPKR